MSAIHLCLLQSIFSAIIQSPVQTFHLLFVERTKAMLSSWLAYTKTSSRLRTWSSWSARTTVWEGTTVLCYKTPISPDTHTKKNHISGVWAVIEINHLHIAWSRPVSFKVLGESSRGHFFMTDTLCHHVAPVCITLLLSHTCPWKTEIQWKRLEKDIICFW